MKLRYKELIVLSYSSIAGTAGRSCWTAAVLRSVAAGGDSAATVLCYWCCQFAWKMIAASILSWEEIAAAVCWYKALLRRKKKPVVGSSEVLLQADVLNSASVNISLLR
ncbi:hypothetical protein H0E87_029844 [Populus deltoides]|uniref:Uncharacterized protein n=1 Tax=Populus deltoides TaxID=3696 RepID=A0A8T2WPU3_POPDE|nr:hypothetical protein H0E87_029844 [Populus deltoides]